MQTRSCNSIGWILILVAIALLAQQGSIGLLTIVVPASLIFAGVALWARNHDRELTHDPEKR